MYKVLAFDIDGTLTNSKKEITPATREAIRQAAECGCKIVIASGRPPQGVRRYVEELGLQEIGGYILCMNGGLMVSCKDGEIISDSKLPTEYYDEIYEIAKSENVNLLTYEGDDVISENIEDPFLAIEVRINGLGVKKVDDLKRHLTFPVNKFLMLGEGDYLAQVEPRVWEKLHDRCDVYRSEPFFLEILPKNIHKARALADLLERLHVSRDELMAFGDGYNDKTMIEFAGMGVAMGNAVEAVKAVADYIAPTNDEDGIVEVIRKFVVDANDLSC